MRTQVVVILATDGLPSDIEGYYDDKTKKEFTDALQSLLLLPVWVVVRLCTDEDRIVEFYNDLDQQLELSLEVLDDFSHEGKEICKHNPWLNYALPLHRCREMGYHNRLFDILDERTLQLDELREFVILLFGLEEHFDSIPDPQAEWKVFSSWLSDIVKKQKELWNPITGKLGPWIDIQTLNEVYN